MGSDTLVNPLAINNFDQIHAAAGSPKSDPNKPRSDLIARSFIDLLQETMSRVETAQIGGNFGHQL